MTLGFLNCHQLPPGWCQSPLFAVAKEVKSKNTGLVEQNLLSLSYGRIVSKDIDGVDGLLPASFEGYNRVRDGDLVLRLTDLQNDQRSLRTGLVGEDGIITSAYLTLRPTAVDARYFAYVMYAYDIGKTFYTMGGGLRQGMGFEDLKRITIPTPPLDVQRRIAHFLEDQVDLSDLIVKRRRAQASLLSERSETLLLDQLGFPKLEPQEIGVQYGNTSLAAGIASVSAPRAWSRVRFKSVVRRSSRVRGPLSIPLLSLASAGFLRPRSPDQQPPAAESLPRYLVVEPNDLVINPMWMTGGGVAVSTAFGAVSPDYRVFQIRRPMAEPRFLHHLLRSRPYRDQYLLYTRANTTFDRRVAQVDIDSLPLSLPPLTAQRQIAEECDLEDGRYRSTTALMEAQNSLLQARKRSLITAAVTGEFDVSTASSRAVEVALSGVGGGL